MMAGDGVIPPIQQLIHVLHPSKLSAPPPCLPANVFEVNGNVAKLFFARFQLRLQESGANNYSNNMTKFALSKTTLLLCHYQIIRSTQHFEKQLLCIR